MQTVKSILFWYRMYFGTGGQGFIFAAALVFLIYTRKTRRENRRILAISTYGILISVICLFPLTARVLMKAIGERVYWRVFWMLPLSVVISCAAVELICGGTFTTRLRRMAMTVLCIVLVGINGSMAFSGEFFTARENNFKLPTPVIRVADAVNTHAEANRIRKKRIIAPVFIAELIRLYDASIIQHYGRSTESNPAMQGGLYRLVNKDQPDIKRVVRRFRRAKLRYLVLTKEQDNQEALEAKDFEKIFDDNGYVVYFDTHRYRKKEKAARKAAAAAAAAEQESAAGAEAGAEQESAAAAEAAAEQESG